MTNWMRIQGAWLMKFRPAQICVRAKYPRLPEMGGRRKHELFILLQEVGGGYFSQAFDH